VILVDTGPLVALIVRRDSNHKLCRRTAAKLDSSGLITTWPCLTEAMHFLRREGGYVAQEKLWELVARDVLTIEQPIQMEWTRCRELMTQYADSPMDLADASLVITAERTGIRRLFTLDRHFYGYLIRAHDSFDIVPRRTQH
jgi:predicted nucleic acid-binding protein